MFQKDMLGESRFLGGTRVALSTLDLTSGSRLWFTLQELSDY